MSFIDVTEQRRSDEERTILLNREQQARNQADQANRTKDTFLATLSHELRPPLSSILTWVQLIALGKVDYEKARQGAAVIEQSAKTQSKLIDDLLDLSRIIAGKLSLEISTIDPTEAIHSAIESVRSLADQKMIRIDCHFPPQPSLIHADLVRFQ